LNHLLCLCQGAIAQVLRADRIKLGEIKEGQDLSTLLAQQG
jgi:hypothetical protein